MSFVVLGHKYLVSSGWKSFILIQFSRTLLKKKNSSIKVLWRKWAWKMFLKMTLLSARTLSQIVWGQQVVCQWKATFSWQNWKLMTKWLGISQNAVKCNDIGCVPISFVGFQDTALSPCLMCKTLCCEFILLKDSYSCYCSQNFLGNKTELTYLVLTK